jgi:hypothetical protein
MRRPKSAIGTPSLIFRARAARAARMSPSAARTAKAGIRCALGVWCSNRLKQEEEMMKESTHHLQKRVRMLEEQNRALLEFGQDSAKRLSKLEAENGWAPPEKDLAAALDACASILEPDEQTATSTNNDQAAEGDDDALDEQARPTQPTNGSAASDADSSAAAADQPDIASLDHSTGVNYIYHVSMLGTCWLCLLVSMLVLASAMDCQEL